MVTHAELINVDRYGLFKYVNEIKTIRRPFIY